jgi:hypothetical protein
MVLYITEMYRYEMKYKKDNIEQNRREEERRVQR